MEDVTALVFASLVVLALVDGACSGFRAGLGRTGLIRHAEHDRRSTIVGLALVTVCLLPASFAFAADMAFGQSGLKVYSGAGAAMLRVLLPYAAVVGLALTVYGLLGWRRKYLAMAVVLGPFTLIRAVVALSAAAAGCLEAGAGTAALVILLGTLAILIVEPLANRRLGPSTG